MLIPWDVIAVFFGASVMLSLAPGPDNLFVLTQSALFGRVPGIIVVLGLCTGLIVHTTAVALGVAAIFQASPPAVNALKFAGAAYLIYLAWQAFRASTVTALSADSQPGMAALYRRGIIMNITNPKVTIFFLAFLPQFANPSAGSIAAQLYFLGGVFILATFLVFSLVALLAGIFGERFARSARAQRIMNGVAAVVFIGLAIRLILVQV